MTESRKLSMSEDQALFMDVCGQKRWTLEGAVSSLRERNTDLLKQICLYKNLVLEEGAELQEHVNRLEYAQHFRKSVMREEEITGILTAIADDCVDILYVTFGLMNTIGLPIQALWDEVQQSNMAKATECKACEGAGSTMEDTGQGARGMGIIPIMCLSCNGTGFSVQRRADGKILKPEGWEPPNLTAVLEGTLEYPGGKAQADYEAYERNKD